MVVGPLISAGASIIGGLLGKSSADKAAEMQQANFDKQFKLQSELATHGVRFKVADAIAAGVHPLYALGATTPSFSPISSNFTADTSMANAVASAGQDIGRAVNATRTAPERTAAFDDAVQKLTLEKMGLENQVLKADLLSKVSRANSPAQVGPAFPGAAYMPGLEGQGSAVQDGPLKRTGMAPDGSKEAASIPGVGFEHTGGGYMPVPSADLKDRIEDNIFHEARHFITNNLLPVFGRSYYRPPYQAPLGKEWEYGLRDGYYLTPSRFSKRFYYGMERR